MDADVAEIGYIESFDGLIGVVEILWATDTVAELNTPESVKTVSNRLMWFPKRLKSTMSGSTLMAMSLQSASSIRPPGRRARKPSAQRS